MTAPARVDARRRAHPARPVPRHVPARASRCVTPGRRDRAAWRRRWSFLVAGWRSSTEGLRRIVHESVPVLLVAGCISAGAGVDAREVVRPLRRRCPALLVLVPAHLSSAGALGGILSGPAVDQAPPRPRAADADAEPRGPARHLADRPCWRVPVYVFNGVGRRLVAAAARRGQPGARRRWCWSSLLGGALALVFVVGVAYYGTIAAVPHRRRPRHLRHPGRQLVGRPRRRLHPHPRHRPARPVVTCRPGRPSDRISLRPNLPWTTDPETCGPCSRRPRTSPSSWSTWPTPPSTSATPTWPRRSASSRSA